MGAQNNKSKPDKNLVDLANNSNPIVSNSKGRACTIEGGKIVLNINNFKEEYDALNRNLEKLKNKMNLIISNDIIEIIQKKLEELGKQAKNDDIKTAINSFSSVYKTNLENYYAHIGEIKSVYKKGFLEISTYLTTWLKEQKDIDISEEKKKIEEFEKNMEELKNKFNKFSEVEELIEKICVFKIEYNSNEKFKEIDNYFNSHQEEINKYYQFENVPQLRSLLNLKELLCDNIVQKNNFAEFLENFYKEYLALYIKIIEQINSNHLEKVEIVNEFNEYNGVIIYHRLIRSIEEKIKAIKFN